MAEKHFEIPQFFTLRALAMALGLKYNRVRYLHRNYAGILEADAETSAGDPLFAVRNLGKIKATLKLHGIQAS